MGHKLLGDKWRRRVICAKVVNSLDICQPPLLIVDFLTLWQSDDCSVSEGAGLALIKIPIVQVKELRLQGDEVLFPGLLGSPKVEPALEEARAS